MAVGTLPPELFEQQQQLNRQQQMAQLLMQQGQQMPQSQMVSGRYVAPSIFQNLAPLFQTYMGQKLSEKGDKQALEIAKQLRQRYSDEVKEFRNLMQGREQLAPEQAGPTQTGQPIPQEMVRGAPNVQGAYDFAASAYNPALQAAGLRKLTEGPIKVGVEDTLIDPVTMKPVFTGAGKPRAPLQIDTGTSIELRDPSNPTIVLQRIPKSQMPTAGQVVERDDGTFLIDTRTGQAKPVMGQGGQPLIGGGKPLTEAQGNSVAFGARAIEANRIATDLEKQGVRNTGAIRTAIGGVVGMTPFVGEQLEQGVRSTFNVLPSIAGGTSPEQQQVEQARRNFVSAVLRKESGAAIGVDEYKNEERKYFPQAGDTDKVIQQKQKARELAIEALKAQAGPSGVRQINQITTQAQGGNTGNVIDFNSLPKGR
jgi:phage gp36-like protein